MKASMKTCLPPLQHCFEWSVALAQNSRILGHDTHLGDRYRRDARTLSRTEGDRQAQLVTPQGTTCDTGRSIPSPLSRTTVRYRTSASQSFEYTADRNAVIWAFCPRRGWIGGMIGFGTRRACLQSREQQARPVLLWERWWAWLARSIGAAIASQS